MRAGQSRQPRLPRSGTDLFRDCANLRDKHNKKQRIIKIQKDQQREQGIPKPNLRRFRRPVVPERFGLRRIRQRSDSEKLRLKRTVESEPTAFKIQSLLLS